MPHRSILSRHLSRVLDQIHHIYQILPIAHLRPDFQACYFKNLQIPLSKNLYFLHSATIFRITTLHFFHCPMPRSPPHLARQRLCTSSFAKKCQASCSPKYQYDSQVKVLQGHFHCKIQKLKLKEAL